MTPRPPHGGAARCTVVRWARQPRPWPPGCWGSSSSRCCLSCVIWVLLHLDRIGEWIVGAAAPLPGAAAGPGGASRSRRSSSSPPTCAGSSAAVRDLPRGMSRARQRGMLMAYDDVLVATALALDVPQALDTLPPGLDRDLERVRVEGALEAAGLRLRPAAAAGHALKQRLFAAVVPPDPALDHLGGALARAAGPAGRAALGRPGRAARHARLLRRGAGRAGAGADRRARRRARRPVGAPAAGRRGHVSGAGRAAGAVGRRRRRRGGARRAGRRRRGRRPVGGRAGGPPAVPAAPHRRPLARRRRAADRASARRPRWAATPGRTSPPARWC